MTMNRLRSLWLPALLVLALSAVPASAQVVKATVKIDGMI